jgi:hypothetical protein
VISQSSAQSGIASSSPVATLPLSSTAARSEAASGRAPASGTALATETLHGPSGEQQGIAEVTVASNPAGGSSLAMASGDHGGPAVASLAPRAGAPASGIQDFEFLPTLAIDAQAGVPQAHGIRSHSTVIGGGRRTGGADYLGGGGAAAESPAPRGADVLTACSPYDLRAIERAIDAFLADLGGPGRSNRSATLPWTDAIPGVVLTAVALGMLEWERQRSAQRRHDSSRARRGDPEAPLPGLPGRRFAWALED